MPFISTSGLIALAIISGIEDISSCPESNGKCLDYFNIKHEGRFKYKIAFSFIMLKTSHLFPFYQTFYRGWMLNFFKSFFKKVSIDIHLANIWWIVEAGSKVSIFMVSDGAWLVGSKFSKNTVHQRRLFLRGDTICRGVWYAEPCGVWEIHQAMRSEKIRRLSV